MKYLSICSGIEAATVAWHGMGWEPLAFSEIEPFPSAVLQSHYPDVPNLGDMTDYLSWSDELLAEVDLLVGGTPCQAFSVAGKRESLGDERGNLSLIFCNLYRHINEIRRRHGRPPAIVVWENVPGVLSTKDNAFGCFLAGIMGLDEAVETEKGKWHKAGFLSGETVRVGYRIIDAQYFGVAQRRRRVFLIAVPCELVTSLGNRACPSEILSLRESVLGNPPARGASWEGTSRATAGCLSGGSGGVERPGESRGQDDVVVLKRPIWRGGDQSNSEHCIDQAGTLNCDKGQQGGIVGIPDPAYAISAGQQGKGGVFGSGRDSQDTFAVVAFHPTQDPISSTDGSTHAMGCGSRQGCSTPAVAFKPSHYTRGKDGKPSEVTAPLSADADKGDQDTVVAAIGFDGFQSGNPKATHQATEEGTGPLIRHRPHCVATPMAVRRLTPRECERLQGFPDNYTDVTYRKKPAADGPRYRALGNSMAVPCMAWIGYRIEKATRQ